MVIGSGPNGLAAAIALARAGRAVTVLEAADAPGGAVRTEELTLPGFRHDTFSSVYPATAASPVFSGMPLDALRPGVGAPGGVLGASAARRPRARRSTATWTGPPTSSTPPSRETGTRGGRSSSRCWTRSTRSAPRCCRGFPPLAGPVKLLRSAGPVGLARFAALLPGSARGLGRRLFASADARAWLYGAAGHGDVPPDRAGLGDRRRLPEPARARGRLAQPARRRTGPDRRAGRLPGRARRPRAHRCAGHRRARPRTAGSPACAWPTASRSRPTR